MKLVFGWIGDALLFVGSVSSLLFGIRLEQTALCGVGCVLLVALGIVTYKLTKQTLTNKASKKSKDVRRIKNPDLEYQRELEELRQIRIAKEQKGHEQRQTTQRTEYKQKNDPQELHKYTKKNFLTACEKDFYKKLVEATKDLGIIVREQIALGSVIDKINKEEYRSELNRLIDFGIFDNNFNLLLLIELNDKTHERLDRQARDARVKAICNDAGIKIITFYTKYPNEIQYIRQRIKDNLQ